MPAGTYNMYMDAPNRINMKGKKIGLLRVIEAVKKPERPKEIYWRCECACRNIKHIPATCLRRKRKTKTCGCGRAKSLKKLLWKGHGEIGSTYWTHIKNGAKDRKLEFSISIEQAWSLYLEQGRKCGLTGLGINFDRKQGHTASLDRIDSTKGYVNRNVMWIHKRLNRLKMNFDKAELVYWAKLIAAH